MAPPLKPMHVIVLKALYNLHLDNQDYCWTYSHIGNEVGVLGGIVSDTRRTVRFLKRRGYVSYHHCFSEDDGLAMGSGHFITAEGINYLVNRKEID